MWREAHPEGGDERADVQLASGRQAVGTCTERPAEQGLTPTQSYSSGVYTVWTARAVGLSVTMIVGSAPPLRLRGRKGG